MHFVIIYCYKVKKYISVIVELYDPLPPYISFLVSINQISSLTAWLSVTVKSSELEWLPEGSQLSMAAPAQSGDKQNDFHFLQSKPKGDLRKASWCEV